MLKCYTFKLSGIDTSDDAVEVTINNITGIARAYTFVGSDSMDFKIDTVAGYGLSFDAANVILAETTAETSGATLASQPYLFEDRIVVSCYDADLGAANTATLKLVVEE
jgi:hypothetical protein